MDGRPTWTDCDEAGDYTGEEAWFAISQALMNNVDKTEIFPSCQYFEYVSTLLLSPFSQNIENQPITSHNIP